VPDRFPSRAPAARTGPVASKLIGFANRCGDNGYTDDVCAPSYDAFFAAALPVVDAACDTWVPPPG